MTVDAPRAAGIRDVAVKTTYAAVEHLRGLQDKAGWWKGELETNVTMEAEDLLLREFLGISDAQILAETARWIRSKQRPDGTWASFEGGPPELSTTVEAWVALRLAGDAVNAEHMARAQEWILAQGGVERSRVFTRIWLALFGLWSWDDLPNLPPELIFLPKWFPLNIYSFGCWARQTIVPLTIVGTHRPVRRVLAFDIDPIRTRAPRPPQAKALSWDGFFQRLDKVLHWYWRHPIGRLRQRAMRLSGEWILARQEADGGWGGIQPPWVYSIMALQLLGYPMDHPAIVKALEGLEGFTVHEDTADGRVRRLEACQSPVWDTGLALTALLEAGVEPDDPAVLSATNWLLDEEITVKGDWAVRRPRLAPSGWAFEFANDAYPDTDDTAEIVLALRRVVHPEPERVRAAVDRSLAWTIGMQSKDGGWGAFDADNTSKFPNRLPFCDFGEVTDPPSADVTAHVVEALAHEGLASSKPARRGVAWLLANQESDGSWFGRWGANYVYGTGAVVPALVAAGITPTDPRIRAAVRWLVEHQNVDGGWGEDLRSYVDRSWAGKGTSTASQTAWALLALLAVPSAESRAAIERGIRFLAETQREDGTWDEDLYTGTGFPGDFYINYHLYRLVFPITALGRYARSEWV